MTIRCLHISDLHVTADRAINTIVAQKLEFIRTHYPDHYIFITGDIVDNEGDLLPGTSVPVSKDPSLMLSALDSPPPLGEHLEIARLEMRYAYELIAQLDLERVFLCPGNHDFGLWGNIYADEFTDAFDEILWRPVNGGKAVIQLGELTDPFRLPHCGARTPVMFTISDSGAATTLQLIFMNTNPDTSVAGLEFASGSVGATQLNKFQTFVSADLVLPDPASLRKTLGIVRFVAFHHHPWFHAGFHKINDSDDLLGLLRRTTDLVLFGHKHVQKHYEASTWEAAGIQYGGLASGWIRSETTATQIVINSANAIEISYVPII